MSPCPESSLLLSRRQFVGAAVLSTAMPMPARSSLVPQVPVDQPGGTTPDEVARDEEYWRAGRQSVSASRGHHQSGKRLLGCDGTPRFRGLPGASRARQHRRRLLHPDVLHAAPRGRARESRGCRRRARRGDCVHARSHGIDAGPHRGIQPPQTRRRRSLRRPRLSRACSTR